MKNVKIVIGANYGDEGKGLLTRYFAKQANNPIVIFHNGSAQRGHTVDYNPHFRHVYHHFGCGTADGAPTYFADTFWVHPMEFHREWNELAAAGITPVCYCDINAKVITPFDMLIDHATEAYITWDHQEPEHGSCGYGTWCATDRYPHGIFSAWRWLEAIRNNFVNILFDETWNNCIAQLIARGVDLDKIPEYKKYFTDSTLKENTQKHFINDLLFFEKAIKGFCKFDAIYSNFNDIIFENAQGLALDQNCGAEWHTTSNTGILNPYTMLKDKEDFNAEVCYVSRSYATRHGIGDMGNEAPKAEINADMHDRTNVKNEFQGELRYGYPEDPQMIARINKDIKVFSNDARFNKSLAITHCNEFPNFNQDAMYLSNNPYTVFKK